MPNEHGIKIAKLLIEAEKTQFHFNGTQTRKDQTNRILQMLK
jgi:hypothetical protein